MADRTLLLIDSLIGSFALLGIGGFAFFLISCAALLLIGSRAFLLIGCLIGGLTLLFMCGMTLVLEACCILSVAFLLIAGAKKLDSIDI